MPGPLLAWWLGCYLMQISALAVVAPFIQACGQPKAESEKASCDTKKKPE